MQRPASTGSRKLEDHLVSLAFVRDPYPALAHLRETDPVHWSDSIGGWLLTRYDDVVTGFKDVPAYSNEGRLGKAAEHLPADERMELAGFEAHYRTKGLLHSDPPDHTRLRRLVLRALSPRVITAMRPQIQAIVDGLLDRAVERGTMEVINDLAFAVPVTVLAQLLGVPASHGPTFGRWADRLLAFQGVNKPPRAVLLAAQQALAEARTYLVDLIERRRRDPGEDLVSLMAVPGGGLEALTDDEIVNTGITLLTAGHETTTSLVGNGFFTLLSHLEQWAELRANHDLVIPAIEEILRYESPVARQPRVITRDTELRGRTLRAGQTAFQMLGAANRDPDQFAEPDRFDIWRTPNRHLAFGQGIHFCVGAPLSRTEGEIVFRSVLQRMPDLRLIDREPDWDIRKANSRVLNSLPVAF
jgi:cytochrome P450